MALNKVQKPILLTLGDPAGIGPEITIKAWQTLRRQALDSFAIIAPISIMQFACENQKAAEPILIKDVAEAINAFEHGLPVIDMGKAPRCLSGKPDTAFAPFITGSIEHAVKLCLEGKADAVVTNPIAKDILYAAGFSHPGHTEFLGELTKNVVLDAPKGPIMMLSGGGLRVALATVHLPLIEAARQLSEDRIITTALVMNHALKQDFGIKSPRISLTGLNPHAGESGALGHEEIKLINPAAHKLRDMGLNVSDAQPADTLFHAEARQGYDAVLAMYHDQGLIPVKTLDFHGGVNITLGLPIVRTSPDHGTAFNIAGQDIARPDSLIAAIKSAREIANYRVHYVN